MAVKKTSKDQTGAAVTAAPVKQEESTTISTETPIEENIEAQKAEPTIITPEESTKKATELKPGTARLTTQAGAKYYFGVDSVTPAMNLVNGNENLYDYVVRVAGRKPDFWGRYISSYVITPEEVAFLHGKGCAILLVYNWTNTTIVSQGYDSGVSQAHLAITQAQAVHAPQNVAIAIDIESGWPVSSDFISGFSDTMRASTYYGAGMFYANPQDGLFSPAYNIAFHNEKRPSIRQEPVGLIWSSEPEQGYTFPIPAWNPSYPSSNTEGTTVWQYAENYGKLIDLNLASQAGFDAMWKAIVQVRALHTCALKPDATHQSKSIHTIYGGDVLTQNYEEYVTDKVTTITEMWLNVTAIDKNGKVIVGFVPQKETTIII